MGFWRNAALGLLVTVGGLTLFGLYVDWKRRRDSKFARRLKQIKGKEERKTEDNSEITLQDIERFGGLFVKELNLGILFLDKGLYKRSVVHFANTLEMCEGSGNLMDFYQQVLPPQMFHLLQNSRAPAGSSPSRAN